MAFRIKQIRHFHQSRKGRDEHYHYIVDVGEYRYCRILFDTNTFTWHHIFRWWDRDTDLPHPLIYLVPPFLLEVLGVLLLIGLVAGIGRKLIELVFGG